ncbi:MULTISPECIES: hypothetical protein [unclassified Mesorhizobium]|uniref:hypothetical protein n=1 Tax=unclassified Mesorhizobium TaxID=325217 RepID=UPI001093FCC0|nr:MULTISPECIES: hypothetical protein [unclassified Mesorhizobium]TGT90896.1 hypothetical protein EN804_06045 [Mesorhizobium sp. M8A.F.Ca.ET.161.01.1.1]TGV43824.1 hypothetical protein EN785_07500 [Mesorhizobium sp. M8A.F.Ca.ET.142.01.1.1]TGW07668.1 hypothetical protein EN788_35475 [Mesorhizobium sp. M2D.F.Ca.ET.145.01.1.1]
MTVTISWWVLPLTTTIVAFAWALWNGDYRPATGYGSIGKGMANAFLLAVALIASLIAWLIWALLA